MNIDLNDEQMREVIGKAVLDSLTADTRETVLAGAIEYLLRPGEGYRGKESRSPLQNAFNAAIDKVAYEVAEEQLRNDGAVKTQLTELLNEAVALLHENKQQSIKKIAEALASSLGSKDDW